MKLIRKIIFKIFGPGKIVGWAKRMIGGKPRGTFVHFERGIFYLEENKWMEEK